MSQENDNKGRFDGWLSLFDATEIEQIDKSSGSRRLKREYIKLGYSHQMSLYGVALNSESNERGYKRVEILSNWPWTQRIVLAIYDWFSYMIPGSPYTIWIYDGARDAISIVGRYE